MSSARPDPERGGENLAEAALRKVLGGVPVHDMADLMAEDSGEFSLVFKVIVECPSNEKIRSLSYTIFGRRKTQKW